MVKEEDDDKAEFTPIAFFIRHVANRRQRKSTISNVK